MSKFAYSTSSARPRRGEPPIIGATSASTSPIDVENNNEAESHTINPTTRSKSTRGPRKKGLVLSLDSPHQTPARWRETYDAIKVMRTEILAPVDGMGCANAGDAEEDPKSKRLSILISLMLSSQTKDEVTHAAVAKLRTALGGEITLEGMINLSKESLQGAINKVGFWPKKTGYIMEAMERLRDDFQGDVPKTIEELTSLKGVGPKMAFLTLQNAWNINIGIGVDVHVHRITNLLGWHHPPTKTPEQTRLNLQSWLPNELWGEINPLLVGFGQTVCLPVGRRCSDCALSSGGLCPSANVNSKGGKPRSPMKHGATPFSGRATTVAGPIQDPFASLIPISQDLKEDEDDKKLVGSLPLEQGAGLKSSDTMDGEFGPKIKIEFDEA
ncbi:DNA glycosylase [Clavulina sp. PMI_390]|nr:DNA glycosylase [Clavulina sp. PMI_390]